MRLEQQLRQAPSSALQAVSHGPPFEASSGLWPGVGAGKTASCGSAVCAASSATGTGLDAAGFSPAVPPRTLAGSLPQRGWRNSKALAVERSRQAQALALQSSLL